jgi:DNA-directed RNA polymerase specialized sigma24 family protein
MKGSAVPASTTVSRLTPSQLLRASQSNGPNAADAREAVVERFGKLLKKISAQTRRRYHLSDRERDEVLAETYQQLLKPEIARFVPQRGKPGHYFKGLVQNAARKPLTQLGARGRKGKGLGTMEREGNAPLGIGKDGTTTTPFRVSTEPPSWGAEAELRRIVDYVMRKAPPRLRRALELCYWENWPGQSIATHLGFNRFTLARDLRAFLGPMSTELGAE